MSRNKKIFVALAVLFTATMVFFTVDILSRTSRPGARKHLIESVNPAAPPPRPAPVDSGRRSPSN
ncbi:MAG: hypothetical protein H7Z75_16335 [Ferruginibacter sp.]|nr:hypothetical protein [Cytophagales bacterium]